MMHKILAAAGGVVLVSLAAVGTFASQDAVTFTEETATVTETVEATETPTETPEPTPTEDANETPEANEDDEDEDVRGIPDSNPVKQPADDDGECEKNETVIKTTPSGTQVNVPCNAVNEDKHEDSASTHDDADDDASDEDGESEDDESEDEDEDEDEEGTGE